MSNKVIRDSSLSYRARGILIAVLSRPNDWRTTAENLAREGLEGRGAILTALTELELGGYIERLRKQDEYGHWRTVTLVYDEPQTTESGLPHLGKPTFGEPTLGNRTPLEELNKNNYEQKEPHGIELAIESPSNPEQGLAVTELSSAVLPRTKSAAECVERITKKFEQAQEAGINAWNLSKVVGEEWDTLFDARDVGGAMALTGWYLSEMLCRPLTSGEFARTGQLVKRFGRIAFEALDFAVSKQLEDPWSYAMKTAEGMYRDRMQ